MQSSKQYKLVREVHVDEFFIGGPEEQKRGCSKGKKRLKSEYPNLKQIPSKEGENFPDLHKRKIVWLKTDIHADSAMRKRFRLGFSDEVWVFINRRLLYFDKNYFNTLTMKAPNGRFLLDNAFFDLPLKKRG